MEIVRTRKALSVAITALRAQGKAIGLVPTMGALHAGHVSLVELARSEAQAVVASIFVNPTQFGPNEDFARYPRSEAQDLEKLANAGVSLAYLPTPEEMYGPDAVTRVSVPGIAGELEGAFRLGFFDGVATVVTKLFMQTLPDCAVFGEKDYQQLLVIKRMAADLDMPVRILSGPTLREPDGLAMASRNRYLSALERGQAPALHRVMTDTAAVIRSGISATEALAEGKATLLAAGFKSVDYLELRDARNLRWPADLQKPSRLLAAALLGTTRLIDNIPVIP